VNEDGSAAESPPGTAHDVVELENSISNFDRLTHVVLSADGLQEFSFANPFVTQTNNARTISVINLTNTRITVSDLNSTTSTNPLLSSVGQLPVSANLANTTSGLVFHNFDENGRRRILVQVDLSEVKAGSESLFIISNTEPNPYIVALPVITNGVNRSSSALRIIATSLLGDPLTPSTFTLSQTFDTSSNSVPASYVSEPLNFDLPVSNYITLPAGIYTLRDDMGRYTRIDIGFLPADTINTLILNPNLDAGLLLLRDSP